MGLSVSAPSVAAPTAPQLFCGRENLPFEHCENPPKEPNPSPPHSPFSQPCFEYFGFVFISTQSQFCLEMRWKLDNNFQQKVPFLVPMTAIYFQSLDTM